MRENADERFEWARACSLGQSFGPWAYHHGAGTEPEDPGWCDECRATWDLALMMVEVREEHDADA